MNSRLVVILAGMLAPLCLGTIGGCRSWTHGVTSGGVGYSKVRTTAAGLTIGYIERDETIGGRPCRRGWVHVFPNGIPAGFTSALPITLGQAVIPPGTWVFQNRDGAITVCSFPHDVEIQGHVCRGGAGGSEGVQTAFYPDGALKQFFTTRDVVVDGVPCSSSPFCPGIELYENGRLRSATLSCDFLVEGRILAKATRIRLSSAGAVVPPHD